MTRLISLSSAVAWVLLVLLPCGVWAGEFPRPQIEYEPQVYVCMYTDGEIVIDGRLDDAPWAEPARTREFVDIEGQSKPEPALETHAVMLWNSEYLYIGAALVEPQIQASFTEHDSYIYQMDNDFEVFIDPDGDTHNYFELEMNALNTVWDLLLTRPYRDGGQALHGWDIKGLKTAVFIIGSVNDGSDYDAAWSVEIAIPWNALSEAAGAACPPSAGDLWRMNFSRVQWQFDWKDGNYVKRLDPVTGEPYPENNWVWSPQGLIAMHYPERWGYVVFADRENGVDVDALLENESVKPILYNLYYCQKDYFEEHGEYALFLADLNWNEQRYATAEMRPLLLGDGRRYQASVMTPDGGQMWIDETGRSWFEEPQRTTGDPAR